MQVSARPVYALAAACVLMVVAGCSTGGSTTVATSGGQTSIVDRTGRSWDITHAVEQYAMSPEHFNFGIGVGGIPSVDEPVVLGAGDDGYPDDGSGMSVFGVVHNNEQRAYSVSELSRHEVFNDHYEGDRYQHVAVAY
jgi:hypothetical protein